MERVACHSKNFKTFVVIVCSTLLVIKQVLSYGRVTIWIVTFTNVPLEKTINICADANIRYCDDSDAQPLISKAVFIELMKIATSGVEFSFNDIMYKQTDGVAMGSPLGPALANIFVGFYEEKLFSQKSKPSTYFRYIDDTFAMFRNKEGPDGRYFHAAWAVSKSVH